MVQKVRAPVKNKDEDKETESLDESDDELDQDEYSGRISDGSKDDLFDHVRKC